MAESPRLYERLAREIAGKIRRGELAMGQRLPSERELAQKFAVARTTVREAMIALELDGLVDVRTGSGVFVVRSTPTAAVARKHDIGPFELLEARRAIEGEACAMAATRITDAQLTQLKDLLTEMRNNNAHDVPLSEATDRRFHELIAFASENTAMIAAIQLLWDARWRSAEHRSMDAKVRAVGIKPCIDEHAAIVTALEQRDSVAARAAMHIHLTQVLEATFQATETEQLQRIDNAANEIAEQRKRYG